MKVVILAGGLGTRLSEATHLIPKPMVEVGGKPILWHIMKTYSHYGINAYHLQWTADALDSLPWQFNGLVKWLLAS